MDANDVIAPETSVRRSSTSAVWAFFAGCFLISTTIWLWPTSPTAVLFLRLSRWTIRWPLTNLKQVAGNCIPGLIAAFLISSERKTGLKGLLRNVLAWRTRGIWYLIALTLPAFVFALALGFALLPGLPDVVNLSIHRALALSIFTLPFGPFWEEIAWRAYALGRLERRFSPLHSALIVGLYWGAWHTPLWASTVPYLTWPLWTASLCNLVCWSVLFAYLYESSARCLPVTILLHWSYLTAQNVVDSILISRVPEIAWISSSISAFLATLLVFRSKWAKRRIASERD